MTKSILCSKKPSNKNMTNNEFDKKEFRGSKNEW